MVGSAKSPWALKKVEDRVATWPMYRVVPSMAWHDQGNRSSTIEEEEVEGTHISPANRDRVLSQCKTEATVVPWAVLVMYLDLESRWYAKETSTVENNLYRVMLVRVNDSSTKDLAITMHYKRSNNEMALAPNYLPLCLDMLSSMTLSKI